MAAGSRLHRKLQESAGEDYHPEILLEGLWSYTQSGAPAGKDDELVVRVSGRADGICLERLQEVLRESPGRGLPEDAGALSETTKQLPKGTEALPETTEQLPKGTEALSETAEQLTDSPQNSDMIQTVDEIKTTYRSLRRIRRPDPVHLAQAKCYAYFYAGQNRLRRICVRMTYCNLLTEKVKRFYEVYSFSELEDWYRELMEQYRPWAQFLADWQAKRTESIHQLPFPHAYREGQRDLAAGVYRTIVHGRKLFLEAPTGTGKTITTLFPSVKAMGEHKAERIFYLTAKTVTGSAAENALQQMREKGLLCKSVLLTAREKICVLDSPDCNPDSCPRAGGHFDRINEAMYDLLMHEDTFSRESVARYAKMHQVCPFELALDMSLFSDVIIGDYNYLFDPHAYLRRFFAEGGPRPYIFLVDEAHNLVDRGREMYSAVLTRSRVMALRHKAKGRWPELYKKLGRLARELKSIQDAVEEYSVLTDVHRLGDAAAEVDDEIAGLLSKERIARQSREEVREAEVDKAKTKREAAALKEGRQRAEREAAALKEGPGAGKEAAADQELLNFYFDIDHFRMIYAEMDDHYVSCARKEGRDVTVHLRCMDPSRKLQECMERGRATVLLSATMLPISYYKSLLGGVKEDYELYAHSVFDQRKRGLYVVRDLTSRYSCRTPENYARIAECIGSVISKRHGNYMVFGPSYSFLHQVEECLRAQYGMGLEESWLPGLDCTMILQHPGMTEEERAAFLESFHQIHDDQSLLGLCVMGGIFSEGIDLARDALIGVIIIGTGIPQVCMERELLKDYFDRQNGNGYDYAYRFPGMNKVQQAAGRVIRTGEDVGIVVLMDDRFLAPSSRRLFPLEWSNLQVTDSSRVARLVERFWDEWL